MHCHDDIFSVVRACVAMHNMMGRIKVEEDEETRIMASTTRMENQLTGTWTHLVLVRCIHVTFIGMKHINLHRSNGKYCIMLLKQCNYKMPLNVIFFH